LEAFERFSVLLLDAPPVLRSLAAGRAKATAARKRAAKQSVKARKTRGSKKAEYLDDFFFMAFFYAWLWKR
jgi:hypothetical protein